MALIRIDSTKIMLGGDKVKAEAFIGVAKSQMEILKQDMSFQKLSQSVRRVWLYKDVYVECTKVFNYQECKIWVEPTPVILLKKEEELFLNNVAVVGGRLDPDSEFFSFVFINLIAFVGDQDLQQKYEEAGINITEKVYPLVDPDAPEDEPGKLLEQPFTGTYEYMLMVKKFNGLSSLRYADPYFTNGRVSPYNFYNKWDQGVMPGHLERATKMDRLDSAYWTTQEGDIKEGDGVDSIPFDFTETTETSDWLENTAMCPNGNITYARVRYFYSYMVQNGVAHVSGPNEDIYVYSGASYYHEFVPKFLIGTSFPYKLSQGIRYIYFIKLTIMGGVGSNLVCGGGVIPIGGWPDVPSSPFDPNETYSLIETESAYEDRSTLYFAKESDQLEIINTTSAIKSSTAEQRESDNVYDPHEVSGVDEGGAWWGTILYRFSYKYSSHLKASYVDMKGDEHGGVDIVNPLWESTSTAESVPLNLLVNEDLIYKEFRGTLFGDWETKNYCIADGGIALCSEEYFVNTSRKYVKTNTHIKDDGIVHFMQIHFRIGGPFLADGSDDEYEEKYNLSSSKFETVSYTEIIEMFKMSEETIKSSFIRDDGEFWDSGFNLFDFCFKEV